MNTQYNIYISLAIIAGFFFLVTNISAQVTIGAATPPENFAILQLESSKSAAMNLPKVTEADKNSTTWKDILTASTASSGLVIFNATTNQIEYWDGNAWIALSGDINVDNGIYNDDGVIKLGGDLTKATAIAQENYNFNMEIATGGQFTVKTVDNGGTPITIDNNSISIQPDQSLSVNSNALKVNTDGVYITSDKFVANINQGGGVSDTKLTLDADNIRFNNLHYQSDVDPSDPLNSQYSGYLLTTDKQGNASWDALRPLGAVVVGKINDNNVQITNAGVDVTQKRIVLPVGQWLVFGLFNTQTVVATGGVVMYNWVSLASRNANSGSSAAQKMERMGGTNPESKSAGQTAYATPSFSYYINVTQPTEIWVVAYSGNSNKNITINGPSFGFLGPSYFFALRLDVAVD